MNNKKNCEINSLIIKPLSKKKRNKVSRFGLPYYDPTVYPTNENRKKISTKL